MTDLTPRNTLKTYTYDIYRLGIELQSRGYVVWENSRFGGVNPRWHLPGSKHNSDQALDANYKPNIPTNREEDDRFDRLSQELIRRGFGVIWNRGPGDHTSHLHAETWGNPTQYAGRVRAKRPLSWRRLTLDGTWGESTTLALQEWLGTYPDGKIDKEGSAMVRALQNFLNTEARRTVLVRDGMLGPKTITQLQAYLGTAQTGAYSDRGSAMVREMQARLTRDGHL